MRKSEEMWDNEFNSIEPDTGCGIEWYSRADKDDDLGGNTTKPPPTKP